MNRFLRKTKGAITIFLILIMLPMFTFSGLIVDGSRISAAKTRVSGAGDLAMNAALSEYDKNLYEIYGLFAVSKNMDELSENVSRYFFNTIESSGVLNDSDSYTRQFVNSIFSSFGGTQMKFNNIVDTKVADSSDAFKLTGVESSQIANPKVMERQIVDFMKFRGPVNLVKGLLTKLGCIGETAKQTKVLEAKTDYDTSLDTIQDACSAAYKKINAFNGAVTEWPLNSAADNLKLAMEDCRFMTEYILAKNAAELSVKNPANNEDVKNSVADVYKNAADAKAAAALEEIKSQLEPFLKPAPSGTDFDTTPFLKWLDGMQNKTNGSLEEQINYVLAYRKIQEDSISMADTLLDLYVNTYYKKLSQEDQNSRSQEYQLFKNKLNLLNTVVGTALNNTADWKTRADALGNDACDHLSQWATAFDNMSTLAKEAADTLDTVISKASELQKKRQTWNNNIDNLSDSEIKVSMKSEYDNSAQDLNEDAINALKSALLDDQQYYEAAKAKMENVTYYGEKVSSVSNPFDTFSGDVGTETVQSYSNVQSGAQTRISGKYRNTDLNGITPAYTKIDESLQFYKYLVKICADSSNSATNDEKNNAKKNKSELIDLGNHSDNTAATPAMLANLPDTVGIPQDVADAIDQLDGTERDSGDTFPAVGADNNDNKKAANSQKNSLAKISELLSNLASAAETAGEAARDRLYDEEYLTEMFSCATDAVKVKNAAGQPVYSLNHQDLSKNPLFGSEAEYILWGDSDVKANLNKTKALIFGIRFALNSIYAFTNGTRRTEALSVATVIAGWTGFGVPIVQTVILLASSLAEAALDVEDLCSGKSVVVYKTDETWHISISGAVNGVKKLAATEIDDIFQKVEDYSTDKIQDLKDSLTKYTNSTIDGITQSIIGSITTAFEQLCLQITGGPAEMTEEQVGQKFDSLIASLRQSSGEGITAQARKLALDGLAADRTNIVKKLTELRNKPSTDIKNSITDILDSVTSKAEQSIQSTINAYGKEFTDKTTNMIQAGGDKVKENVSDAIDNFTKGISGSENSPVAGSATGASGFKMNYKEYLKAFMLIHLIASTNNLEAMLKRAACVMQVTISSKNSDFNISKSYTMVQVSAAIDVRTTFFSVPVVTSPAAGGAAYQLDYSKIGTGWQRLKYTSILGY